MSYIEETVWLDHRDMRGNKVVKTKTSESWKLDITTVLTSIIKCAALDAVSHKEPRDR